MIYRIHPQDSRTLLEKPETGMGYQIITASQYNRNFNRKFIVYNTDLAIELDSHFLTYKRLVVTEGYKVMLNTATELMLETNTIKVFDHSSTREYIALSENKRIYCKRQSGGKGATDSQKEYANGTDYYVRLSAYEDDKRIDFEKNKLKPGSFTTTLLDYTQCVSTNDEPIDRYALPNNEEIKWAFYIRPKSTDILQKGIVQPAFEHAGGGIEAYFEKGTSDGTYILKKEYGKF
ncbi:MAG: hypothetical protein ABIQ27_09475 [Flavobacterium sp.]|uniref:hypothetical protein n=1 Tax=Flavobacterium sp. TaxID=239 RepID=UPI003264F661